MGTEAMTATGFYALATSGTAAALKSHVPQDANGVYQARAMLIRAITNNSNFTLDNTVPTASANGGMPLNTADTSPLWIHGLQNILRFQAISQTSTGYVNVIFFN